MLQLGHNPDQASESEKVTAVEVESAASHQKSDGSDLEGSSIGRTNFTEAEQKKIL
jgi:hypothetical protein